MASHEIDPSVRAVAGITLKNHVRLHIGSMNPVAVGYVKQQVILVISDPETAVRSAAGSIITTILSLGFSLWPEVLNALVQLLDSPNPNAVEGAFGAFQKICEDCSRDLDMDQPQALGFMIQKFITHFGNPNWKVRAAAIQCCNQFIITRSPGLMANMEPFVQGLYERAGDPHWQVRKSVCQAMVMILEAVPQALIPQLDNVVAFMLHCTGTSGTDEGVDEVALEACEFWLSFAEQDDLRDHLEKYLPAVVPVLLNGMIYSDYDLTVLTAENKDSDAADESKDIKPQHHKARKHTIEHDPAAAGQAPTGDSGGADDDSESDWDDDDDTDVYTEWNLRKCSAAALDVLATVYENELLPHILPRLKEELFHQDCFHRECGILALGAVAEGCLSGMMEHLPMLVPHLITCLKDPEPLVRAITCWTLGRYAGWTVDPQPHWQQRYCPTPEALNLHRETYFRPLVLTLLEVVLDNNKRVQEAACSALATVEEDANHQLGPYLETILTTLATAFTRYQDKNLLILYDAVGTLADAAGPMLQNERFTHLLIQPLVNRWAMIKDLDRGIFPLFECMTAVSTALQSAFQPYAVEVWTRCLRTIQLTLQFHQNPDQPLPAGEEAPDKDFIVVALDLLSGVAQGLGVQAEALVAGCQPSILTLLPLCLHDPGYSVRQSAFALLGDLAINCFGQIKPHLNSLLPELLSQLTYKGYDPAEVSVINNAIWSVGEISLKYGPEMEPWASPLLERLILLLVSGPNDEVPRAIAENAAISIGRLGYVCPAIVAPHLRTFIQPMCGSLRDVRDNAEKESAFQGVCRCVELNPQGVVNSFVYFCDAISQWNTPSPELAKMFATILIGYRNMYGAQWEAVWNGLPMGVRERLNQRYGLN
ncbi:Transportin-1 [Thoreauomyces humboldtii]|nr:Transportin-1 [Thoreauomyces humboldtii]